MPLKTTRFDVVKYLSSVEDIAEFLADAKSTGHPGYIAHAEDDAERARLRLLCAEVYQIVGALAEKAGAFEHADVAKVLDNLHAAASGQPLPHDELLPFSAC